MLESSFVSSSVWVLSFSSLDLGVGSGGLPSVLGESKSVSSSELKADISNFTPFAVNSGCFCKINFIVSSSKSLSSIPISKVSFGFAAGGSEFSNGQEKQLPFGGGSGAGVSINPVAFLVVQGANVKLLPVSHSSSVDKLLDYVPELMDKANNNLYVEMQYGDFSIDDIVSTAEIKMNYGDANIKKAKQINAKINYGDIDIADVNSAVFKMNYGSVKLDNVNRLIGELNYSDINVNNIEKHADIYVNYGDVTVNKISQDFESMEVQLNYSDIILNLTEDMSFTYDIKLLYGDIENDLLDKYAKRIVETKVNTKSMTGNINDSEGKHKIIINGNYSDVE